MSKGKRQDKSLRPKLCQEKCVCASDQALAQVECKECATLQCKECEFELHKEGVATYHQRNPVSVLTTSDGANADKSQKILITRSPAVKEEKIVRNQAESLKAKLFDSDTETEGDRFYSLGNDLKINEPYCDINMPSSSNRSSKANGSVKHVPIGKLEEEFADASEANGIVPRRSDGEGLVSVDELLINGLIESTSETYLNSANPKNQIRRSSALPNDEEATTDVVNKATSKADKNKHLAKSFLLIDDKEKLQVKEAKDLYALMKCDVDNKVKVISIFGNTGDGKSYTMNHVFFGGHEVFKTSPDQDTCTVGVWAAYDPSINCICIDTEGLLGVTTNEYKRTRLLLKVLAVSDIVLYRTCADRLHTDLYQFLGDASVAYTKHFQQELKAVTLKNGEKYTAQDLGPCVIVFHETTRTNTLDSSSKKSAAEILRETSSTLGYEMSAFSSMHYVGTKTTRPPTDFSGLRLKVDEEIKNSAVRSPRSPAVVLKMLQILSDKFHGDIYSESPNSFPDEFFTCGKKCLACLGRCTLSMNHTGSHCSIVDCKYVHVYDNQAYLCKKCFVRGKKNYVIPKTSSSTDSSIIGAAKYALSGYVLECRDCGVIYRSRQYWYGNCDPTQNEVHYEIRHVWPGEAAMPTGTHNAARKLLDGVKTVADTVGTLSSKPARLLSDWVADQVAPPYWVPNNSITACHSCARNFADEEKKHHCRACGKGFCDECTQFTRAVPERGWGPTPVRVCKKCKEPQLQGGTGPSEVNTNSLLPRLIVENVQSVLGSVAAVAIDYPIEVIKDSARPVYWRPDDKIKNCNICDAVFGPKLKIHHCRACGEGVCVDCSNYKREVPSRGWETPVRVCSDCNKKEVL